MSSVGPGASTSKMAGDQPLEHSSSPPGAFPETPAFETPAESSSSQNFFANPIPASEGAGNPVKLAPGESVPDPSTFTNNTVTSQVRDDPSLKSSAQDSEQTFGVSPIPATGGIGNPVSLQPGEQVPHPSTFTGNTINSNVRLDKESYERGDTGAPVLPAFSPEIEREAAGGSMFGLGPQTSDMIPESSMGMGRDTPAPIDIQDAGPMRSSVAPQSTTNELAGLQPVQSREPPAIVTESQQEAHVDPEASASPRALQEKDEVENELHSKVPQAPVTSGEGATGADFPPAIVTESQQEAHVDPEASASPRALQGKDEVENELHSKVPQASVTSGEGATGTDTQEKQEDNSMTGMAAGGLAAAGAAAAGTAYAMRDQVTQSTGRDPVSVLPQSVQESINSMNRGRQTEREPEPEQPATSDAEIPGVSQADLPQQTAVGESVRDPSEADAAAAAARSNMNYVPEQPTTSHAEIPNVNQADLPQQTAAGEAVRVPSEANTAQQNLDYVPEQVKHSQKEAQVDPEASASPRAVQEKNEVENELLSKVPTSEETGEPAPSESAALSATAPVAAMEQSTSAFGAPQLSEPPVKSTSASGAPQLSDPTSGVEPISLEEKAGSKELNAPAGAPAQTPADKGNSLVGQAKDSRDVSPMTRPAGQEQEQPIVTTGVGSSSAPVESKPAAASQPAEAGKPVGNSTISFIASP